MIYPMKTYTEVERSALIEQMNAIEWWHTIDIPSLGVTTAGREPASRSRDAYMKIPWGQMSGKTVLDIGAWDGLYSFEAEHAGASRVIAADQYDFRQQSDGIEFAKYNLESKVEINSVDVESLESELPAGFEADFVFFFGVLYHLKNPYTALGQIATTMAPGGLLILETALTKFPWGNEEMIPILEFTPHGRDGDETNFNYPNRAWVEAVLRDVGFVDVQQQGGAGLRAAWHARWPNA